LLRQQAASRIVLTVPIETQLRGYRFIRGNHIMKKQKLGSGVGYGHRTLKVEQLERRAMLAGNVNVSVSGGNLFVTGDNQDNAVLIQEVDDGDDNANTHAYEITGFDFADSGLGGFQSGPTNITGGGTEVDPDVLGGTSARIVKGVTANIIVDLKKGNDALAVGNSIDDLLTLAEDCGFGLGIGSGSGSGGSSATAGQPVLEDRLTTPVSLIINMGDGNNAVAVIGDIGVNHNAGSLVVNGGKNADAVAVGNTFDSTGDAIVHGDVSIATGKGDDNICVDNATIFGALAVNAGDGFNTVGAENFGAAAVAVVSGKNDDSIRLVSFDTDAGVTVNAGNGNNNVLLEDFDAGQGDGPHEIGHGGGAVTVVTGSGHDNVGLFNFTADNVVVSTGSGDDGEGNRPEAPAVNLQPISFFGPISVQNATITNALVVSTGNGNDFVDVDNVIAHDIVVDTGAGNDGNDEGQDFPIEVDNVTVAGNVTVLGGSGNDRLEVLNEIDEVSGTGIRGNLIISGGAGNDDIRVGGDPDGDEGINIGKSLIVDAGSGNDFVDLEGATIGLITNIQMGAGNDELDIFSSGGGSAQALLIANGGSGRDSFFNDRGIDSNGNFAQDGNGVPHEIIQNFEFFEADAVMTALAKPKKGGW
jgi:hypothetical protein